MAGRHASHGFARSDRVAEQIRRELADLLRFGVKDPRLEKALSLTTITAVEVSPDYSHAKVYYTSLANEAAASALGEELGRLSGFLRRELGKRIRIHQIPALHFHYDKSVERGSALSRLIDEAVKDLPPPDGAAGKAD